MRACGHQSYALSCGMSGEFRRLARRSPRRIPSASAPPVCTAGKPALAPGGDRPPRRTLFGLSRTLLAAACALGAARLAAAYPDLSKGRPPIVLDARIGTNTRLGDDPAALPASQRGQAEPHIARSSVNPEFLLATFQEGRYSDGGAVSCGYALSRDGGFTWTRDLIPNLTLASGGRYLRATDPVAGTGPLGELYLQTLTSTQGAFDLAAIVVSRSLDGGVSWSAPATVFESRSTLLAPDKNWLAVNDLPGTPNPGRLVSTWSNFNYNSSGSLAGVALVASYSDDRGATWSTPAAITPPGSQQHQGTQPVFLPDGSLYVVYIEFLASDRVTLFNIQGRLSTDGGRTFPATATKIIDPVVGWDDPVLRDGVFLPSATAARQSGELFVTCAAVVAGSPRVLVTKSSNRGLTWTAPVTVSDQPAGGSVMNPAIAVTPDGRTVAVVFMDKRNAPDGVNHVDHYAAISLDGGVTWLPNLRLTEMSSDIRLGPQTPRGVMLGDYLGVVPSYSAGQPFVAVWCDTRTGDADPFVVRFAPAPAPDYATWAAVHGLGAAAAHQDDFDGDGTPNYLEFVAGTNPRRTDSGQDLFVRPAPGNAVDVLWTERANLLPAFPEEGISAAAAEVFAREGFGSAATLTAALAADQLPSVAPTEGLAWRGVRRAAPNNEPLVVARSYLAGTSLPVKAAADIATVRTDARLINLSTRGRSGPGASQMIVGFVLDGNKSILVRAAGPALAGLGVGGSMADPRLSLAAGTDFLRTNDNWSQGEATPALFTRLGAFSFPAGSLDSALLLPLEARSYTAAVASATDTPGLTLLEVYDADARPGAPTGSRLVNASTRGEAGSGDNALIAGLVLSGTQPRSILLRAVGPSLASFGLTGFAPDPVLTLYRGATQLAANDDWEIGRAAAVLAATASKVGAFPLVRASRDSALLLTVPPGAYTVVVSSGDAAAGLVLVEVYDAG